MFGAEAWALKNGWSASIRRAFKFGAGGEWRR